MNRPITNKIYSDLYTFILARIAKRPLQCVIISRAAAAAAVTLTSAWHASLDCCALLRQAAHCCGVWLLTLTFFLP